MTTSSPVDKIATRGLRRTISQGTFMAAAIPISRAVKTLPAWSKTSPVLKSRPAGRTNLPLAPASRTVTVSPLASVSSWMTIVSAPLGTGAPVKMRAASPGPTLPWNPLPAADSPTTFRSTGS